jgi:hypothetical protein
MQIQYFRGGFPTTYIVSQTPHDVNREIRPHKKCRALFFITVSGSWVSNTRTKKCGAEILGDNHLNIERVCLFKTI